MNANQQRLWMLADEADWCVPNGAGRAYEPSRRTLRLVSARAVAPPLDPSADLGEALSRLEQTPWARDEFGARIRSDLANYGELARQLDIRID